MNYTNFDFITLYYVALRIHAATGRQGKQTAFKVTLYKYCMASSVTVHIFNIRKILLPEAKPRLTVFTRMLTICTVTLGSHAIFILLYRTKLQVYSIYSVPM